MSWTVYYYLQRQERPLSGPEREILADHTARWCDRSWECEPYHLALAPESRPDGLLGCGAVKLPQDPDHDDVNVLLAALGELRGAVDGARLWVADDHEMVAWSQEDGGYVLDEPGAGEEVPEFEAVDDFVSARAHRPPPLGDRLREVLARLRARDPISAAVLTPELAGELVAALIACDHEARAILGELELLAEMLRPELVVAAGWEVYPRLSGTPAWFVFRRVMDAVDAFDPFVDPFLREWDRPGCSRYHYVDLESMPDGLLGHPRIEARMCDELVNWRETAQLHGTDRVELAALVAARGSATETLVALVELARRSMRRRKEYCSERVAAAEALAFRATAEVVPSLRLEVTFADAGEMTRAARHAQAALERLGQPPVQPGSLSPEEIDEAERLEARWCQEHEPLIARLRRSPAPAEPSVGSGAGEPRDFFELDVEPAGASDEVAVPFAVNNPVLGIAQGGLVLSAVPGDYSDRLRVRAELEPRVPALQLVRCSAVVRDAGRRAVGIDPEWPDASLAETTVVEWEHSLASGVLYLGTTVNLRLVLEAALEGELGRANLDLKRPSGRGRASLELALRVAEEPLLVLAATAALAAAAPPELVLTCELSCAHPSEDVHHVNLQFDLLDAGGEVVATREEHISVPPIGSVIEAVQLELPGDAASRVAALRVRGRGQLRLCVDLPGLRYRAS